MDIFNLSSLKNQYIAQLRTYFLSFLFPYLNILELFTMKLNYLLVFFLIWSSTLVYAQPTNDDCSNAFQITNPSDWCSGVQAFTNGGATIPAGGGFEAPDCFTGGVSHDVWFAFTGVATDLTITVNGSSNNAPGGTLEAPQVALYAGLCSGTISQLECQEDNSDDFVFAYQGGIIPGNFYLIRVDGLGTRTGTFELCVRNYNAPVDPSSDCSDAAILCDKSSFGVDRLVGGGNDPTEFEDAPCFFNGINGLAEEFNSVWFKWTCEDAGSLTFSLTPQNPIADLDFVLFELPAGLDDCANKEILRCMAAGKSPADYPSPCHGPTGLNTIASDVSENAGCDEGQDNWVSAINMQAGVSYALGINNFGPGDEGFVIDFGGTGTFVGPKPVFGFDKDSIPCQEQVIISDSSFYINGTIVGWEWSFGQGAVPQTASGQGPHTVTYNTVGTKFIALSVESDEGCITTEILPFLVTPCCNEDYDDLGIEVSVTDILCHGDSTGIIDILGIAGTPFYLYSINDMAFQPIGLFTGLPAGIYDVAVSDQLGCIEFLQVEILQPPALIVNAGVDQTVDLGNPADLNGAYTPSNPGDTIFWMPDTLLSCTNCLNPTVLPLGTTTYTLSVMDESGCVSTDEVTVFVTENRPIYIPNIFSPNNDGLNDGFTLYGGPAIDNIEVLNVYDRWGNHLFAGEQLFPNEESMGWDGTYKGKVMLNGVYTFYAEVRYIDGVTILYEGDITLIR